MTQLNDAALILGIESSCDETAASVVRGGRNVLSNIIASQHDLHAKYAGVVPEIASRAHVERIVPVVREAASSAGIPLQQLDAIAVGHRPGLIGSLLVGVSAAKSLAWSLGKPIIGVDHVHAHLYAGMLNSEPPRFPALGLVVSGGHTSLFHIEHPMRVSLLGRTIDDAIGEAFDKAATILQLEYPGGPAIDALAHRGNANAHHFPVSALGPDSLDFSFSGLKTSLLYAVCGQPVGRGSDAHFERSAEDLSDSQRADFAASFQSAATSAILIKLKRALAQFPSRTLIVGGGVSANTLLRSRLIEFAGQHDLDLRLPDLEFCLDNAAMIAGLAFHRLAVGDVDDWSLAASPRSALHTM